MPASSMITRVSGPIRVAQSGTARPVVTASTSLARVSAATACSASSPRRICAAPAEGASPMTRPAVGGPGRREGAHRHGLARPGGGERELDPRTRRGQVADHRGLVLAEGEAVRGQTRAVPATLPMGSTRRPSCRSARVEHGAFGVENGGGAVAGGAGDLIDRGAVRAPQDRGFVELRAGGQRHRQRGGQDLVDDGVDDPVERSATKSPARRHGSAPVVRFRRGRG